MLELDSDEDEGRLLGAEELERDVVTLDELVPTQLPPAVQACCQ